MRLALISDIHGNSIALDAVLADVAAMGGADAWWVLGDLVALGHDPVGVLERVAALPNAQYLSGNTERYVLTGAVPFPRAEHVAADPSLAPRALEVTANFAWTRGIVTYAGWWDWLCALPRTVRTELPDGTRVLGVHASPGSDDGPGISTRIDDDALAQLLDGCDADIVFGGHTHDAVDRVVGDLRAVNLGSVGNSKRADRRASYVVVDADEHGHTIEHRLVDYDHEAVCAAIDAVAHPAGHYLKTFQVVTS
ncbi:MAG TPA: metallophosphoesterase family protein [Acidimicrobiia bacterium]|nr:metallophosphoesterase family protein [Acidimicrobiia bacterium]